MHRLGRALARCSAALGALIVLVTVTPLVNLWSARLAGPWDDPSGDILIVLGGDDMGDETIGYGSYLRTLYAVRAWREGAFRRIVVSGDGPISRPMVRFLMAEGVPETAIQVEGRSTSTRENATFVAAMLGKEPGKKILLTSDYHMFRAVRAFRKAGLAVEPRPLPDALKRGQRPLSRWNVFLDLLVETGKTINYLLRGWI